MIQIVIGFSIVTILLFLIIKYTCNMFGIPEFVYKFLQFLFTIPWYVYVPIILLSLIWGNFISSPTLLPKIIIFGYLILLFTIYILAYLIGTPQNYM